MTKVVKPKARDLIVVPRMPARPDFHTGNPFTTLGDIVADCECGYHVMGPREEVKKALDDHRRMFHSDEITVVRLNDHTL